MSDTGTIALSFKGVGHTFQTRGGADVEALAGVDLEIRRHEFVAVVGPSGCGKSTLLRLAAGLIFPTRGAVEIFGNPISEPPDGIGIVFQKPTLLPWLSVTDNVLFPIRHKYGRGSSGDRDRAMKLLEMVGLGGFADRMPDELSGGMQQRAAIARALLLDPDILLMDEPFSALDALTREEMGFELQKIWAQRPKTVLFITHSVSEAVLLSDRVFVMSARPGEIVETLDVDLPRPRDIDTTTHPRMTEMSAHLRSLLLKREDAVV